MLNLIRIAAVTDGWTREVLRAAGNISPRRSKKQAPTPRM